MVLRELTFQDTADIDRVLLSREEPKRIGVNWDIQSIVHELKVSQSLGCFDPDLKSFILFKDLGAVLEILLIYSHKQAPGAAEKILKGLVDAHGQHEAIWLEVHEDNVSAIRFYEQQGFEKKSRRNNYYPDGRAALNYTLTLVGNR